MTTINRHSARHTTMDATGSRRRAATSARRPSPGLILDAVVASYIHEISQRHRRPRKRTDPDPRQRGLVAAQTGPAGSLS